MMVDGHAIVLDVCCVVCGGAGGGGGGGGGGYAEPPGHLKYTQQCTH